MTKRDLKVSLVSNLLEEYDKKHFLYKPYDISYPYNKAIRYIKVNDCRRSLSNKRKNFIHTKSFSFVWLLIVLQEKEPSIVCVCWLHASEQRHCQVPEGLTEGVKSFNCPEDANGEEVFNYPNFKFPHFATRIPSPFSQSLKYTILRFLQIHVVNFCSSVEFNFAAFRKADIAELVMNSKCLFTK